MTEKNYKRRIVVSTRTVAEVTKLHDDEQAFNVPNAISSLKHVRSQMADDDMFGCIVRMLDYIIADLEEKCRVAEQVWNEQHGDPNRSLN